MKSILKKHTRRDLSPRGRRNRRRSLGSGVQTLEARTMFAADLGWETSSDYVDMTTIEEGHAAPVDVIAFGDFNGDGNQDVALGMPRADINAAQDAGAVRVLYSGDHGLQTPGPLVTQDILETERCESGDRFGAALAVGDFNRDGIDDLAIGAPEEDYGRGAVHVLYGSHAGLQEAINPSLGFRRGDEEIGGFGTALATGDFNGDGHDELAVGTPYHTVSAEYQEGTFSVVDGAVHIFNSSEGVSFISPASTLHRDDTLHPSLLPWSAFGSALVVGDFNGDGTEDLAVSAPEESVGWLNDQKLQWYQYALVPFSLGFSLISAPSRDNPLDPAVDSFVADNYKFEAGAVYVWHGSSSGLEGTYASRFHQGVRWDDHVRGIQGRASEYEHFGSQLTVGDFNGDGHDDLAIGVPGEDNVRRDGKSLTDAGAVNVVFGSSVGLTEDGNQIWHQNDNADHQQLARPADAGDRFGAALASGDFDGDGLDDLAVGVPQDDQTGENAGVIEVLAGSAEQGLEVWGNNRVFYDLDREPNAQFGAVLAAADLDGDGMADLAVGVPGIADLSTSVSGDTQPGASGGTVEFLYGADDPLGPGSYGWQSWDESTDALLWIVDRQGHAVDNTKEVSTDTLWLDSSYSDWSSWTSGSTDHASEGFAETSDSFADKLVTYPDASLNDCDLLATDEAFAELASDSFSTDVSKSRWSW